MNWHLYLFLLFTLLTSTPWSWGKAKTPPPTHAQITGLSLDTTARARLTRNRKILRKNTPTVVFTNCDTPNSFDPLYAKFLRNSRMMRLLYATPVHTDKNGTISSHIFSTFHLKNAGHTLAFTLKNNITFSDGKPITLDDVSRSLLRILFLRREIQPLASLQGVALWLQNPCPLLHLPQGIKINHSLKTMELHFTAPPSQGLEQLSMLMFGIIPAQCIDPRSGQLSCARPPGSGPYHLIREEVDYLQFGRRLDANVLPTHLDFLYFPSIRLVKYLEFMGDQHIIMVNSNDINPSHLKTINRKLRNSMVPETSFFALLLNKNFKPFAQPRTRHYFAQRFRRLVQAQGGRVEASLFTKLMPGYLSWQELAENTPDFSPQEEEKILASLRQHPLPWQWHSANNDDLFLFYLKKTLSELEITSLQLPPYPDKQAESAAWQKGEIAVRPTFSSFGSRDPRADVQLYFSSNLNHFLTHVHNNPELQSRLKNLSLQVPLPTTHLQLQQLNRFIFEDAMLAVLTNFSVSRYTLHRSKLSLSLRYTDDCTHFF